MTASVCSPVRASAILLVGTAGLRARRVRDGAVRPACMSGSGTRAARRSTAMLELWDYLVQFLVTACGFCAALREYYRARRRPWFLLTCFYATFALGTLYWTLHLLLRQETPQVFYVSDLAWLGELTSFSSTPDATRCRAGGGAALPLRGWCRLGAGRLLAAVYPVTSPTATCSPTFSCAA